MKLNLKKMTMLGCSLLSFGLPLAFFSCGTHKSSQSASLLAGLSSDELSKQGMGSLAPRYDLWSGEQEFKIAIFYTLEDHSGKTPLKQDVAYGEMANMQSWITGYGRSASFLDNVKIEPATTPSGTESYLITGKGLKIGNSGELVDYRIILSVGKAELLAPAFGEALATNHLTMLNGHFSSPDPSNPKAAASLEGSIERVYGPAMDAFKAKAPSVALGYRMVLFNNCHSEQLEDLVFKSVQDANISDFSMLSQRGISNYAQFSSQISSLLVNVVKEQSWTVILDGLKGNSSRSAEIHPVLKQIQ